MTKTLTLSLLVSMALALGGCPDKKPDATPAASAEPGGGTDKSGPAEKPGNSDQAGADKSGTDKAGAPKEDKEDDKGGW
jgi:hypothetical protein